MADGRLGKPCLRWLQHRRRLWWGGLAGWLVLTLFLSVLPGRDCLPWYHWALFAASPQHEESYFAVRLRLPGEPLVVVSDRDRKARGLVKRRPNVESFNLVQNLGRAWEGGKPSRIRYAREQLEAFLLHPGTSYLLVKETGSPIQLWKNEPSQVVDLAEFETGQGL